MEQNNAKRFKNNRGNVEHDEIVSKLIPNTINECSVCVNQGSAAAVCSDSSIIADIAADLGINTADTVTMLAAAKDKLGCKTERCVLEKSNHKNAAATLASNFKLKGPRDSTLLNNYNLDETLLQWQKKYKDFYVYNFNMLDYEKHSFRDGRILDTPDTLATVDVGDLMTRGFRRAACIINSDKYSGPGKHWMALYFEVIDGRASIEFFNSSGNPPAVEWVRWMTTTRDKLLSAGVSSAEVKRVSSIRQQSSKSECGVYSLFYVWARLHGVPITYFESRPLPDQIMFEFRQHLFYHPKYEHIVKFDFDKYSREVKIEWE